MNIHSEIQALANPDKAKVYARFFKTGKGEYGEGDQFLGLTVPQQRIFAKKYIDLPFSDIEKLLLSKYHEHRLTGFLILVYKYDKFHDENIIDFYLKHKHCANNWDLIDCVADKLLGHYLFDKDRTLLYMLAQSKSLWDRRISIITTFAFIRLNQFDETIKISKILLHDTHDLIHKAVGWMLREVGKRDENVLLTFLDEHSKEMPRTMLRYAIERLDAKLKKKYMVK